MVSKRDIVKPYLVKFPNHGDLTLAKKIYKENPLIWTSLDTVRTAVRRLRGHIGEDKRNQLADKSLVTPVTYNSNPYNSLKAKKKTEYLLHFQSLVTTFYLYQTCIYLIIRLTLLQLPWITAKKRK
jgi:hypothetical protein